MLQREFKMNMWLPETTGGGMNMMMMAKLKKGFVTR